MGILTFIAEKTFDFLAPGWARTGKDFLKGQIQKKEKENLKEQVKQANARDSLYEQALVAEREKSRRLALIIKLAIFIGILYGIYHYFEFTFLDNTYENIKVLLLNIYEGIKWLVIKIYDIAKWIFVSIYDGIKWVFVSIYDFIIGIFS